MFHSIKPTGELEQRSLHTACPVIKGVKWSAPKWVHVGHYAQGSEAPEAIPQQTQVEPWNNGRATCCAATAASQQYQRPSD